MPAGTRAHGDDAVDTLVDRLLCVTNINYVMEYDTAIAVHCVDDFGRWTQARNDDRHLVLDARFNVMLEPVIALMHDLIHRNQ